ncbi:thyroid transcription factor 1-associated protein 26 homolog [Mugil cephalus]|uniref:thyroid transcription factor 1-associated protein 26 homolog n=1 Tax=Mugil cephalus TaxID=48193 RepID=UPI001FB5B80C|nr:thyroid transcription factor 1-associated protein 26 homolog [Mugil cephalus]
MAPTDQKMKNKKFAAKDGNLKKPHHIAQGVKKKKKWVPERQAFEGSIKEGQGFAFKRKQKVKYEYNKLLRKEKKKKKNPGSQLLYKEEYPEHLRHLYEAEAEKLRNEVWTNRVNRSKMRIKGQGREAAESDADADGDGDDAAAAQPAGAADEEVGSGSELKEPVSGEAEPAETKEKESLPISNRMKKKMQKKTSYQKTKEEFERVKERRIKKKEEYLKNKQQREEAIQKYKQKKMETFQMLSKKTKKGQPNLNLQMEYLLQKIQRTEK